MLTLYHGTERDIGSRIIASRTFIKSLGDEHWLGDGIYFYEEKNYAFRWIYISYSKKYPMCTPDIVNILKKYTVLAVDIIVAQERIFDLTKYEHKAQFDKVHIRSLEKIKNHKINITDGAVLNFMFHKMEFNKKYDLIKAMFIHEDNDISITKTRLAYIPETQYCVINKGIIENIRDINISEDDLSMFSFAQHYNDKGNGRLIKYKPRRNIYKG
ncbi:hypothetical protein D7V86_13900 [bacterium D16-51]|nr:hypothetical protein D7V96_10945 [bacterium D16-59]RKI59100.1 hypothetical protein D7V86_13900 [bacterium D16-51]